MLSDVWNCWQTARHNNVGDSIHAEVQNLMRRQGGLFGRDPMGGRGFFEPLSQALALRGYFADRGR
jgi:hypothetical protein